MKQTFLRIKSTELLCNDVFQTILQGDIGQIKAGQFIDIKIEGFTLRRPISVCDFDGDSITIVYKTVGEGTLKLSDLPKETILDVLTELGNGYDTAKIPSDSHIVLVGGGLGVPPLYALAKSLKSQNISFDVVLGFNSDKEIILYDKFKNINANTVITTADGSCGIKGFVTSADIKDKYVFACGPMPMLKAVYDVCSGGQFSFETRMACGFGVCQGCTIATTQGFLRVCADGPVFTKEQIIW
jgi:dihydroorotate dehydrogenase electron transfer subunit